MPRFVSSPLRLLLPALLLTAGCAGERQPVAEVEVGTDELVLPYARFATLELSWRLRAPLGERRVGELYVFVHLLDGPGSVVRTFDYAWTGSWLPGEQVESRVIVHQSILGPPLDPGSYDLTLGLYDGAGRRWPLVTEGELVDRYEYRVARVRVPPPEAGGPMFQFSSEWLDSEPGRDRQVLAGRWLTGPGRLLASGFDRPIELWLRLLLPGPGDRQQLVLSGEASQQAAAVRTDCGDVDVQLAGEGHHDVLLPVVPPAGESAAGTTCAVEVRPGFYLLELESGARRAVSLDGLAWR